MRSFVLELKRRNVLRAAGFYAAASWLLVQVATQVFPFFDIPNWIVRRIVLVLVAGFPIVLLISWFYELTPQGLKPDGAVDPSTAQANGRRMDRVISGILGVAVVVLLANLAWSHWSGKGIADHEQSIAVMPFVNTSGDTDNEYFSDGLTEELIAALGRLQGLKVIGRASSFQFKNKTADSKAIGSELGVASLLEGSVRKQAGRVRIVAELVNASDSRQLWSDTYDRDLKDIFATQSDIAGSVASQLKLSLLAGNAAVAKAPTPSTPSNQNVDAYTALLQGNFSMRSLGPEHVATALQFYAEAIRLDPDYALAYAEQTEAHLRLFNFTAASDERNALAAKARTEAAKALAIDPDLAEAHRSQGRVMQLLDFNFAGAEAELQRAAELAPQDAVTVRSFGNLELDLGHFDKGIELLRKAVLLDPLDSNSHYDLALALSTPGRYDEAEKAMQRAIELTPQGEQLYAHYAVIEILRGNPAAALQKAQQETDPFWQIYALAMADFAAGQHGAADLHLKKLIDEDAEDSAFQIAQVYAMRKEPDLMFTWLEKAWKVRDGGLSELLCTPFMDAYKDDPRFIALAGKVGVLPAAASV